MDFIASKKNSKVGFICSLRQKKHREAESCFLADGRKLFLEAKQNGADIRCVAVGESYWNRYKTELEGIDVIPVKDEIFSSMTDESAPEGIITCIRYLGIHKRGFFDETYPEKVFMCCDIQDPGNLGTIIRTADAFGCECLILCGDCADIYNPKTVRSSMGGLFRQKIIICRETREMIASLKKDRNVYAAALDRNAMPLSEAVKDKKCCYIVGNEGHGLSGDIIECCSGTVFIPMTSGAESLNVSQAATVILWEQFKDAGK